MGGGDWNAAALVAAGVGGLIAAVLGAGGRLLLGRLRRGAKIRVGVLESISFGFGAVTGALVWPAAAVLPAVWAAALLVVLSAVDLKHHRLPDAITLPAIPLTCLVLLWTAQWDPVAGSLPRAVAAALVLGAIFFSIAALAPVAMGRGDAKLVISLGLMLGYQSWPAVIIGMGLAFVLGGIVGVAGMLAGRLKLRSALPFGPFLLFATWALLLLPELPDFLAR